MDNVFGNFFDLAADFLSRIQVQLDSFARAALENAEDRRIGLQTDFVLGEQTRTTDCRNQNSEKK